MRITVILLNWNGGEDTLACLASLAACPDLSLHNLVVDNGSTDGSADRIAARFPAVELLRLESNHGFTGGNNHGLRLALGRNDDPILVLNNDTLVPPACLGRLIDGFRSDPRIGAACPVIWRTPATDQVWYAGGYFDHAQGRPAHLLKPLPGDTPQDTYYATGCALLLSPIALREVGLFDDAYFALWEDTDLSLRLQQSGWRTVVIPTAHLHHKVGSSYSDPLPSLSPRYTYLNARNHLYWLKKHFRGPRLYYLRAKALESFLRRYIHARRLARPDLSRIGKATLRGIADYLLNKMGPFPADL